ncbi:lytic transglycosylase domain-containing protein [Acidihalobacter yilgarnensis]|uniref:lytic transglycosylase domain-containing protein n=1 Tax=Acidihalobacter yilgarnensis TaxID=2819280 RepID=UPI0018D3C760|nr:lytic transglycosylase domain-containing protein [Acidihalobacter yilgarnensis]
MAATEPMRNACYLAGRQSDPRRNGQSRLGSLANIGFACRERHLSRLAGYQRTFSLRAASQAGRGLGVQIARAGCLTLAWFGLTLGGGSGFAQGAPLAPPRLGRMTARSFLTCARAEQRMEHVPAQVLAGIARVEGGRPGTVRVDANGTRDFGIMQVNSVWLPRLHRRFGITRSALRDNVCANVLAASYVLSRDYRRYGDWWQAVEAYHAGYALGAGVQYATRVMRFAINHGFDASGQILLADAGD